MSLYDDSYVDFDKSINTDVVLEESNDVEPLDESMPSESDKLLNMIRDIENRRSSKAAAARQETEVKAAPMQVKEEIPLPEFCIVDGEKFSIVSASRFTDVMGCYLAKNEKGYTIIGFAGDKTFKIKHYEKLSTEKLQSRVSETLDDGTQRILVRIGIHKFILNIKADDMQFVMDLC